MAQTVRDFLNSPAPLAPINESYGLTIPDSQVTGLPYPQPAAVQVPLWNIARAAPFSWRQLFNRSRTRTTG